MSKITWIKNYLKFL